ncbi:MAG: hypothetical protein GXP41_01810 [Chloroflexi bacterium]|nr:hypothetical protein [Chloroflexota bacterium]
MKKMALLPMVFALFLFATVACGRNSAPPAAPRSTPNIEATVQAAMTARAQATPTPDVQATIDAAVAATAQVTPTPDVQATVNAAVSATAQAQANVQATVDTAVQATTVAAPTPTPSAEYVTMSEEELAALIDQAVAEASTSTQECSTAATQATADDTVTQDEVQTVEVYLANADEAIAYADEVINAYNDLYGELATESLATLQAIEQDLAVMSQNTAAINDSLQEINTTLEAGLTLAEDTINQLESAAQAAQDSAQQAQQQVQGWAKDHQSEIENRAAQALSVKPNNIPADAQSALASAFSYVDAIHGALGDNKITKTELMNIAQLGANTVAGFQSHGDLKLQKFAGSINNLTGQLARGQVPQAKAGLGKFEKSLGARPAGMPSVPSGPSAPSRPSSPSKPSKPSKPSRRG